MAELRFRVKADYEELGKLRTEIQRLKEDLRKTGANTDTSAVKAIEAQLATLTKQYEAMTRKIAEAEAQYDMLAKKMTEKAKEIARAQDQLTAGPQANVTPQLGTDAPAVDQSIEAQAKAYEELKNEIDAIAGSKTNLIKQMLDEQNAIRLINAELKQINAQQKESGTQTQAQKERVTQLNASLLNHKEALSEVRQSLSNYVKLENAASGSMNELSQSLGRMRMVYRTLSEEERNSPFGQELLASIQQADAKIKELDATIGNHQRNVGNYGQAWNGLGNSIQQLARELPALANGPRVFFSAISNNLPILADEIKRARTEYDKMVKNGEKGVPVWKQIGASIFSWQTALTVGITLLTMYGDEIVEWGKKMIKGGKAALSAEKATRKLNDTMAEGAKNAAKEIVQIEALDRIARDATRTENERNIAAKKVLETIGQQVTATNIAKEKNGEFAESVRLTTEALIDQAEAQAGLTLLQEEYSKVMDAQAALAKRRAGGVTAGDMATATRRLGAEPVAGISHAELAQSIYEEDVEKLEKAVEKATDAYGKFKTALMQGVNAEDITKETTSTVTEAVKTAQEEVSQIIQAENDAMRDRARAVKDMQLSVEQARIDGMAEGYDKMKAQRELNLRKEIEQLNRQKEDYIRQVVEQEKAIFDAKEEQKAKEDKNYKIQIFDMESAMAEVAKTDPVVAQYAQAMAYTRRQFAVEAAKQDKQWAKQNAQMARELEQMTEQARIDTMKEGYAKVKAQRELDNKKELEQLERQKNDYIRKVVEQEKAIFDARENQRAKENKEYKKQTFDEAAATKRVEETDVVVQQYTQVVEYTQKKQQTEARKQDIAAYTDSLYAYLEEYGTYEAKKLAITRKYEKEIAEESDVWAKASLAQKMKEELADLDIEANKTTNAIARLFGDMRDKTVKELDGIAEKGKEALEFLKGGQWDASKGLELGITKETFEIWSKSPEKLKAIMDALLGVEQASDQLRNSLEKIVEGFKDLFDTEGEMNNFKESLSSISAGVGEILGAIGFVSDSLASMGEALGSEGLMKAADAINSALNVADQTMQGAQAGAAFGPWGAAIGAAVGLASSLVTEISKAKDAIHDAEIERLAKEVETLDKSYDSLGKSIEKAFSADASKLIEQQNTLLEQKKKNLELMLIEEKAKKNADEDQIAEYEAQLEELDATIQENKDKAVEAIAGQDVMSAIDSFANAYAEAWANGEDAAEASTKAVRNMLKNSLIEFLKGQLSDEVESFNKKLAEVMKDGVIEPWEEKELDALKDKMDSEAQELYEQTSKYWQDEEEAESQQAASRKGYETLSEDTGNELVGRATAQYESNLRMEAAMMEVRDMVETIADLKSNSDQTSLRDIAAESRAIIADSFLELQQIRENTGAIIKPIKNLSEKMDKWDSKIMSL